MWRAATRGRWQRPGWRSPPSNIRCRATRAALVRPTSTPSTAADSMSAAEGIGRRALLGGAAGLLIASEPARAAPVQGVVGAPDGDYRSLGMHGKDGSTSWAYPRIRYARATRFRAPVPRSEEHPSELQALMRNSSAVL